MSTGSRLHTRFSASPFSLRNSQQLKCCRAKSVCPLRYWVASAANWRLVLVTVAAVRIDALLSIMIDCRLLLLMLVYAVRWDSRFFSRFPPEFILFTEQMLMLVYGENVNWDFLSASADATASLLYSFCPHVCSYSSCRVKFEISFVTSPSSAVLCCHIHLLLVTCCPHLLKKSCEILTNSVL